MTTEARLEPDGDYDGVTFDADEFDGLAAGGSRFIDCAFDGSSFEAVRLRRARFTDTRFDQVRMISSDLAETGWVDVTMTGCVLAGVQAFGSALRRVTFTGCKL